MTAVSDRTPPATRPRVIGMLGGMSWESTAEYYRLFPTTRLHVEAAVDHSLAAS
jgi:hypothetical protein